MRNHVVFSGYDIHLAVFAMRFPHPERRNPLIAKRPSDPLAWECVLEGNLQILYQRLGFLFNSSKCCKRGAGGKMQGQKGRKDLIDWSLSLSPLASPCIMGTDSKVVICCAGVVSPPSEERSNTPYRVR